MVDRKESIKKGFFVLKESPEERVVRLIQVKNWYCNIFVPEEPEQLLEILEASNKYSCNDRPTVVTCLYVTWICFKPNRLTFSCFSF